MSIAEYCQESVHCFFSPSCSWFYPGSLGCTSSGSWSCRKCQVWAPSLGSVDHKLDQSWFGQFHKFWSTIAPARTDCRLKVLQLGRCPSLTAGDLSWLDKMARYISPITRRLYQSLVDFRAFILHQTFTSSSKCTPIPVFFSHYSCFHCLDPPVSIPTFPQFTTKSIVFSFSRRSMYACLNSPC